MQKNKKSIISGIAVAASIAALGASAYYLLGPKAKAHQKKAKILFDKMRDEIRGEVKRIKEVTPPVYHKAVDTVSENYAKKYKLYEKDIRSFAEKLKGEWEGLGKIVKKTSKDLKK
jgi:hypothetical protein